MSATTATTAEGPVPRPDGRARPRGPVDRRLWHHAPAFRWWLTASVAVGGATTIGLIAQASFLARAVADAVARPGDHQGMLTALGGLAAVTLGRAGLALAAEQAATGAARRTKTVLRAQALRALAAAGPTAAPSPATGEIAVTLGHGLDALDGYIGRYLPRVVLGAVAPVVLVAWIARLDWLSAGILLVTLVLLPIFMVLIGRLTTARVASRWAALTTLSGQFLDAVEGLATLRAFGRARAQRAVIAGVSDQLRRTTLATLRVALLSALVLETLAAVGTALVAVPLGLRLLSGTMTLAPALTILILTPEVYLPLRRASAEFHANAEGSAALDAVFARLDPAAPPSASPSPTRTSSLNPPTLERPFVIDLRQVAVRYPGRADPALGPLELTVAPGEHLGVVGQSGAGKTTLVGLLAGLVHPTEGQLVAGGVDLTAANPDDWKRWRARLAWVPQRPGLLSGSVADNLRLGQPDATDTELWAALDAAGLTDVIAALPGGLSAAMAEHAGTLSAGERQRLGLARALTRRDADVVLLDEPTAHLDPVTEAGVVDRLSPLLAGRTLIVVTHRPLPLQLAERTVTLAGGRLATPAPSGSTQPAMAR